MNKQETTTDTISLHCGGPVSYTHLDVYKRQTQACVVLYNKTQWKYISINTKTSLQC